MKIYTIKSNARRAARQAGLDPETAVKAVEGGFVIEAPEAPAREPVPGDSFTPPDFVRRPFERAEAPKGEATAPAEEERPRTRGRGKKKVARAANGAIIPEGFEPAEAEAKVPRTNKTELLIAKLKEGATVAELTAATGWLPHTLRARISGLAKDPHNLQVERTRKDGVTSYKAVA